MKEQISQLHYRLDSLKKKLQEIRGYFDLESLEKEVDILNHRMAQSGFWDRPQEAQETIDRLKSLKKIVDPWQEASKKVSEMDDLLGLLDEHQEESFQEMQTEMVRIERDVEALEFQRLLSDSLDSHDAIVSINAGAGGTESCDWVAMLLRMFMRWAEKHHYAVHSVDLLAGEEAGIKNTTFIVEGSYAYGYLKAETGVHRLVRISPFDANKRRHTSFASVDVIADVEDVPEIQIKDSELRIDTFRAGGAGGQHVNKTSSAVRITHLPTGIVAQCQNERSQHQNKQMAMKILKARLYERYRKEREEELKSRYGEKKEIAWGSQIRSYVFHPYTLVKDHRTNVETSNGQAVLDGDLDDFIFAYLKQSARQMGRKSL
ncbi:MAG: peptide chain release factor 2 [Candidatus Omnitrophica bacterium]|nr:peptide chain release factor 2 [Candidatus Omnitrophota bacterium]